MNKVCSTCKESKPVETFVNNKHRHTVCKRCSQTYNKQNNDKFNPVRNPKNWKLAAIAKTLFGNHRIRKDAHGRYVKQDFTPEEQTAILLEYNKHEGVLGTKISEAGKRFWDVDVVRRHSQNPVAWKKAGTRNVPAQSYIPADVHKQVQLFLFETFGGTVEEGQLVDYQKSNVAIEVKPELTQKDFDQANGKLLRLKVCDDKHVALLTLHPVGPNAQKVLQKADISLVVLDWKTKTVDEKNSIFLQPEVKQILTKEEPNV